MEEDRVQQTPDRIRPQRGRDGDEDGQRKNVLCHKLVCRGTLEERVDAMLAEKRNLAGEVLATGGELPLTELSDREILRLLTLDVSRALGES